MGARATSARWFRTPMPKSDPYDFSAPMIIDRERVRRFLAETKAAGMMSQPARKAIIDEILATPETALGRAVRILATYLEWRYLEFHESPAYRGLSTILASAKDRAAHWPAAADQTAP